MDFLPPPAPFRRPSAGLPVCQSVWQAKQSKAKQSKAKQSSGFGRGGHLSVVAGTQCGDPSHQGRVGWSKGIAVQPQVVFQSGAGVPACRHAPFVQCDLMRADASGTPFGVGQQAIDRAD